MDPKAFKSEFQRRLEQRASKEAECRARLEVKYNTECHHMRDLVWSKAWEHGHSAGLYDVEYWYGEFAEMLT